MPRKSAEPSIVPKVREQWSDKQALSGSKDPWFSCNLANQVLRVPWRGSHEGADDKLIRDQAVLSALIGIGPQDATEGMLAAQMVAVHEATTECFRRAALAEQTFAGRDMALKHGAKLARTYATLVEALDRHRGKGQPQVVRVERVTVEAGGQAIVGIAQGGGGSSGSEDRAHAQAALADAREPALRCSDQGRVLVPVTSGPGA